MFRSIQHIAACAALVTLLGACAGSTKTGSGSRGVPPEDLRLQLVDQARWAMSAHNMQPWEIALDQADSQLMRVYLARDRLLPATDPYSRQIVMSLGGFLAVLEDAAAARGYTAHSELFPEGEFPSEANGASFTSPVAVVRIAPSSGQAASAYPDAISGATVKANLAALTLSPADEQSYLEMNKREGVELRFVQDAGSLMELKPVLKAAFRLEMQHEPTLLESYELMRRNRRQLEARPWGLSYGSNFPQKALGAIEFFETVFPMNMKKWGLGGADNFDREVDNAGAFLIITTDGNSRQDQILAGMLFQRVWLKAIHEGYAIVPASQPLQEYEAMANLYKAIHETFAQPEETIQMIAWLGTPDGAFRPGFRISTENLLRQ